VPFLCFDAVHVGLPIIIIISKMYGMHSRDTIVLIDLL